MADSDMLYSELKPDIEALAAPLFEISEQLLRRRGNFLPHGAVLTETGEVKLVTTTLETKNDYTNSTEVLPILHQDLRNQAVEYSLRAIGVAENVNITPQGQARTDAVKVLFEHKRGLTVALYLPFKKKLLKGYVFGEVLSLSAAPEINAW